MADGIDVCGIVLAAGRGERMGGPKALLPWRETTFLDATLLALRAGGISMNSIAGLDIVVVLDPRASIRAAAGACVTARGARAVDNAHADDGMLSSVHAGLDAASPSATHVLLMPVDHPGILAATIADVLLAAAREPDRIVIPTHRDRRGHPGVFPRFLFDALRSAPADQGARAVLRTHADRIRHIAVDDPWVVRDLDTPSDL